MATYKIYALDDRNVNERDSISIQTGLLDGAYYYAGSVEADSLEIAYCASQNDNCPNPVTGYESGNPIYGPAVWNGEFAQISTKVGDVFEVDGELYRVSPAGFDRIAYGEAVKILLNNTKDNPWAPGGEHNPTPKREINTEFDNLITD